MMKQSKRIVVIALVAVMVFSALSVATSRQASAAGALGTLYFKVGVTETTVDTNNPLRYNWVDEYVNGYSILDTLLTIDQDYNRIPWIAYSYQNMGPGLHGAGGDTYRMSLVHNACFVDPTASTAAKFSSQWVSDLQSFCNTHPLTASDVAFSFNLVLQLHSTHNGGGVLDSLVERFAGATVVDRYTVDLSFTAPYAPWFTTIAGMPILPQYWWGNISITQVYNTEPRPLIGSGPMLYNKADHQSIILDRNPVWWGTVDYNLQIRPDEVQYIAYGTQEATKLALLNADIDLDASPGTSNFVGSLVNAQVFGLPVQRVAAAGSGEVFEDPDIDVCSPACRTTQPQYKTGNGNGALFRADVRQAIRMLISPQASIDNALLGLGSIGDSLIPRLNPWHYSPKNQLNFNIANACNLLQANGWTWDGVYALANTGAKSPAPVCGTNGVPAGTILAADWVCASDAWGTSVGKYKGTPGADANGFCADGKIDTGLYGGEILKFRFATLNDAPEWERMYRLDQGWAAQAGIRLMDGSNSECGNQKGCGILSTSNMVSIWLGLDYDLWVWDWVNGITSDPSPILWLETNMAITAYYSDNGYSNPYYDALYNMSLIISGSDSTSLQCRRTGVNCVSQYASVSFTGNGFADRTTVAGGVGAVADGAYLSGRPYSLPYIGTDGMQQIMYDGDSYILPIEPTDIYAFHEFNWVGFGDWNSHPGLSPFYTYYFLYFQISPRSAKAPQVAPLPAFQAVSGQPVTLSAIASSPNALTYTWDLDESVDTSGDFVPSNDADATGASPTVTAPSVLAPTVYNINVRVSDGTWTQKVRGTLTVSPAPQNGVLVVKGMTSGPNDAWASYIVGGTTYADPVTFFASAADLGAGCSINSAKWLFGDGASDTTGNYRVQHAYASSGVFTATVVVGDTCGRTASLSGAVRVGSNAAPFVSSPLPTLQAYIDCTNPANTVIQSFRGLASDVNTRDLLAFSWAFGDGGTSTAQNPSHTYNCAAAGQTQPLTYTLSVSDGASHSRSASGSLYIINGPNHIPVINCLVYTAATGSGQGGPNCASTSTGTIYGYEAVTVTAQVQDADGDPLNMTWTNPDSSTLNQLNPATVPNAAVSFAETTNMPAGNGQQRVTVSLTDGRVTSPVSTYITITTKSNTLPTLTGGFPAMSQNFGPATTFTFSPVDTTDLSLRYTMNYGDGSSQTGTVNSGSTLTLTHTYATAGPKSASIVLDDLKGAPQTFAGTVTIYGTLASFPFPFVQNAAGGGKFVLGLSQPKTYNGVPLASAASTIDVVGGVPVAGAIGSRTTGGQVGGLLDTEAVTADGTSISAGKVDLMGFGGRGNNLYSRVVNPAEPVRQATPSDGSGRGIYCGGTNYVNGGVSGGGTDQYALFAEYYDPIAPRYNFLAAGLSGFATRAMSELIALNLLGRLPAPNTAGSVLTGTGVAVRLHDQNNDSVFETYQVVCGTGGAVVMGSAASIPSPGAIAQRFAIGNSQVHGVASAASTIDVVGGVALASRRGRDLASVGVIWGALDQEIVTTDGLTVLNTVDPLVSLGGRGNNLVTRYYNPSVLPRLALPGDGSGFGIFSPNPAPTGTNYRQQTSTLPYQSWAFDSWTIDANNRRVEIVAGLSGFATRQSSEALADPSSGVSLGSNHGIVISLLDNNGDGLYDIIGVADTVA